MSLDIRLSITRFKTLARTASARLDGDAIQGEFATDKPLVIDDPIKVCEIFANCSESSGRILSFTQKYAPLDAEAKPGKGFRFQLSLWRDWHTRFRWYWKEMSPPAIQQDLQLFTPSGLTEAARILNLRDEHLEFSARLGNSLVAARFSTLIDVCFTAIPIVRLRVCPQPDCKKCFVAHHLKQVFCGNPNCIEWGRRRLKLEYWERNKERLLAERKQRRGLRNVTRKAR